MKIKLKNSLTYIGVGSLTLLAACGSGAGKGSNLQANVDKAKKALVRIIAEGRYIVTPGVSGQNAFLGSGAIMDKEGFIITNNHVAAGASVINVKLEGSTNSIPAVVVGLDECKDLAVLKVDPNAAKGMSPLNWFKGLPQIGLEVVALGYPGNTGAQLTSTEGSISTAETPLDSQWASVEKSLFHSAKISGGNSGGPLLDRKTNSVIGVNFAGNADRNIAISSTLAEPAFNALKKGESIQSIGAAPEILYDEDDDGKVTGVLGVMLGSITPGKAAFKSGLKPGDVLTEINGIQLDDSNNQDNYSLKKYCDVLRSSDPKTAVLPVKIARITQDGTAAQCVGEINGKSMNLQGTTQPCPEPLNVDIKDVLGAAQNGGDDNQNDNEQTDQDPNATAVTATDVTITVGYNNFLQRGYTIMDDVTALFPGAAPEKGRYEKTYHFSLAAAQKVRVYLRSFDNKDLDLALFKESDQAGRIHMIAEAATAQPDESLENLQLPAGQYWLAVNAKSSVAAAARLGFEMLVEAP